MGEMEENDETDVESTHEDDDLDSMTIGSIPLNVTLDVETAQQLTDMKNRQIFSNPASREEVQSTIPLDEEDARSPSAVKQHVQKMWEKVRRKSTNRSMKSTHSVHSHHSHSVHSKSGKSKSVKKERTLTYSSQDRHHKSVSAWSNSQETMLAMDADPSCEPYGDDLDDDFTFGMGDEPYGDTLDTDTSKMLTALKNSNGLLAMAGISRTVDQDPDDEDSDGMAVTSNLLDNELT